MPWVKLDDGYFRHPKAIAAGPLARELNFASWCWSSANLTDGQIPKHVVPLLAAEAGVKPGTAGRLVDVGLWHDCGDHYQIHDYLDRNPSRVEVEEERRVRYERKAEAGRKGGIASGEARRKQTGSNGEAEPKQTRSRSPSTSEANGNEIEAPSRPVPSPSGYISSSVTTAVLGGPVTTDDDDRMRIQALAALRRRLAERPDLPIRDTAAWVAEYIRRAETEPETHADQPKRPELCGACENGLVWISDTEIGRCTCQGGPAEPPNATVVELHPGTTP